MKTTNKLHLYYKNNRLYKQAFIMLEKYHLYKDSINSEQNQKAIINQEYKYKYEKQAAADSVKSAEKEKVQQALLTAEKAKNKEKELEVKNKRMQSYFLIGGLILALIFGGIIFNRFRITNSQKQIIEQQKATVDKAFTELEEKNHEILDSINYAKRIQNAILPPDKLIKNSLPNSFVLYKPKDIVAGDFYWLEKTKDSIYFAAADCTGHGVPGAMVSVICNNGLNRSVREYGLSSPSSILDKTRELVIKEFEKSEEDVKDGMDIALCSINQNTLFYAGANNPLWIIRNDSDSVEEIKANKQPIGKYQASIPFNNFETKINKGDTIYLFSDGYVDQFGGPKNKKFKSKAFKELLVSIQNLDMESQRNKIDIAFENWKGSEEQIDDVCVIGVRI